MRAYRSKRFLVHSVLLLAGLLVTSLPAEAQLGGALRRAAGRKAEQKVEEKAEDRVVAATLIAPTFDGTRVEITGERLDRYIAAMQKMQGERAQNRKRYDALQQQAADLREQAVKANNEAERNAFLRAGERHHECRNEIREKLEADAQKSSDELEARIQRDPVGALQDPRVKKMQAIMMEMASAQQRGDAATVDRTHAQLIQLMGAATDSVSLDRAALPRCGARPTPPASVIRADALSARAEALVKEANALLSLTGGVKGADVGLSDVQSRMVWERIQSWLNGVQDSAPITRTFSRAEYDLLVARRGALRAAFSGAE